MLDTAKLHNALLALYRLQHGRSGSKSSWGQGGAAAHGQSMRYADANAAGMSPSMAKDYSMGNMLGGSVSGGEPSPSQLLSWAKTSTDPRVQSIMKTAQSQVPRSTKGQKGGSQYSILERLVNEYQEAIDKANAANQARADQGSQMLADRTKGAVGRLEGLHTRTMEGFKGYGEGEKALLDEQFREALQNQQANLSARGLGGTTIGSAFAARNARDKAIAEMMLRDRINDRKTQYDTNISQNLAQIEASLKGDEVSFIERQTDQGPDPAMLANITQALGQSGYGSRPMPQAGYGYGAPAVIGRGGPVMMNASQMYGNIPMYGQMPRQQFMLRDRSAAREAANFRRQQEQANAPYFARQASLGTQNASPTAAMAAASMMPGFGLGGAAAGAALGVLAGRQSRRQGPLAPPGANVRMNYPVASDPKILHDLTLINHLARTART